MPSGRVNSVNRRDLPDDGDPRGVGSSRPINFPVVINMDAVDIDFLCLFALFCFVVNVFLSSLSGS